MVERELEARFYRHRTADDDRPDIAYYRERANSTEGPVLEVACGTGRVYLPILEDGVDIDGFDIARDALSVLRDIAHKRGLKPNVWQVDMTDFAVERSYDLAYCPFNAIQVLRSNEEQLAMLESVSDALAPGGSFVFDVFVPSFDVVAETYGEWQAETVEFRGDTCEYRTRARLVDEPRQHFDVEYEARDADRDLLFEGTNHLTMLPHSTVEALARLSPFEEWAVTGDFTDEPLADGHSIQVWELRK
jgi:SAM-dependent methyltransferase